MSGRMRGPDEKPGETLPSAYDMVSRDVGHLLRVGRQQHTAFRNADSPSLLTPTQFAVLLSLAGVPDINQRTVADLAALDESTVSELIHRLTRKGLVEARPDPDDGRRRMLRASRHAIDLVQADGRRLRLADELFLAPLSPAERSWLLTQLRLIAFSHVPDASTFHLAESADGIAITETNWAFGRLTRICMQVHATLWAEEIGTVLAPQGRSALEVLSAVGPLQQGELGEALSLVKASMAGLTTQLERFNYIEKKSHAHDRRRKVLRVTTRGRDALRLTLQPYENLSRRLLEPIEAHNQEPFLAVLRKVTLDRDESRSDISPA
ncbi:MarR family transcriptional regulator [Streptomyces sp. NPDC026665]|uniref:MarR family winged helix-turn-helix transcriptional regulator n=1 Tax=Streptomyces sp. NPDC026665 TaxID=3154798 RepID=UPI0033C69632